MRSRNMVLAVARIIHSAGQTASEDLVNPCFPVPDNFSISVALKVFDSVLWDEIFVAGLCDPCGQWHLHDACKSFQVSYREVCAIQARVPPQSLQNVWNDESILYSLVI